MHMGLMLSGRQKYIQQSLVPEASAFEVVMAIGKAKIRHKSPGTDQIPAEMIKAGGMTVCSAIHKCINSLWNKEELPKYCMESITVPIYKGDKWD